MHFRHAQETDYLPVISVIDHWWGGRQMADMLPKLFFQHFQNTSFIAEQDGEIIGFLIGLVSQTEPAESYVHFVGVHPAHRNNGIANRLYEMFFEAVRKQGCTVVRCVTSPVNKTSISFHTRLGFRFANGTREEDGVPVQADYDGIGQDRVLFVKKL